jgi:hypothetical protein
MKEVGRKPLLRFLHSPHPCGLATQGAVAEAKLPLPAHAPIAYIHVGNAGAIADDCKDAGGRAMQEQLPRIKIFRSLLLCKQIPFKVPVKINHIQLAG